MTVKDENTVKESLTTKRLRRSVENTDYAAFARRVIKAHGRRVASGDVEALPDLLALADHLESVTTDAVLRLRLFGYSWAEIASRVGITRQAAQQRWGGIARAWYYCPECNHLWWMGTNGYSPDDRAWVPGDADLTGYVQDECYSCLPVAEERR